MKKILLTLATVVLSLGINAQDFKHYSLNEVNGDTIQYLQKNFIEQKAYFIGKPFSRVIEVYLQDLPLNFMTVLTTSPWEDTREGNKYVNGVSISWVTDEEGKKVVLAHIDKVLDLYIHFEPPYTEVSWDVEDKYDTYQKMIDHLKNYIVKEIEYF